MKQLITVCIFLLLFIANYAQSDLVNPVIGNISFIERFGNSPDNTANEETRIITHLSYVKTLLQNTATPSLTENQKEKRGHILDLLHQYIVNGIFPKNYDYPEERKPCFIDKEGAICAVGYLVEQTEGRNIAEDINSRHQYDNLLDMNEPILEEWASANGLTLQECAMIQPMYGPIPGEQPVYADIKPAYGISSGIIGGSNLAISTLNVINFGKGDNTLSYIGLATGTGQVIMGLANIRKNSIYYPINGYATVTSYKEQNNLSYINIAMGTSAILTSTLNLVMNKKSNDKRNAFNLYSYPNINNTLTMGFSFTRKI